MTTIKRGFADVAHGQMHYREAGAARGAGAGRDAGSDGDLPVLMLHASPGSSRQLAGLIGALGATRNVVAPDTPGNGDSGALSRDEPTMPQLAQAMIDFMDALGIARADVYGSHTGAAIAAELAILAPERVRSLSLDGLSTFEPEDLAEILEHYAHPFEPDLDGAYLARIFHFCRDQYVYFPWYRRTVAGHRVNALPDPHVLHAWVLEVMKAHDTYHLNYHAAFRWNGFDRLPLVTRPVLMFAGANDPLIAQTEALAKVVPDARYHALPRLDDPAFAAQRLALMHALFDEISAREPTP